MITKYIINTETSSIYSYFENGYEYAKVIEGKEAFLVCQTPNEIVRESFLHVGSCLEGALKASSHLLKKKYKLPVALSIQKNIVLIRCSSADKKSTVWLINSHIQDIQPHGPNQTIVYLKEGLSQIVDISTDKLQEKRNQASFIHTTFLNRSHMNKTMTFLYEKDKGIILVREKGQINYTVKRKVQKKIETPEKF